jgi:glycosyltransferase involved in cell wall biosynthesis
MSSPLRILLWSPKGAGLHYGGPGMTAYRLYAKAAPGRFEITLAHGNPDHQTYPLFKQQHLIRPLARGPISQLQFIRAGRDFVRRCAADFDIFHGLQGFDLTVGPAQTAQQQNLPAVVKLAAYRSDLADKPGLKALLGRPRKRRDIIKQLGAVIAISRDIYNELLEYHIPENKIAFIPNGVDTDLFCPLAAAPKGRSDTSSPSKGVAGRGISALRSDLRAELGWPQPDRPALLFAGGINRRKQPHLLVEALIELKQRRRDLTLILAGPPGEDDYVASIQQNIDDHRLADRVLMPGFTPSPAPLYQAADFFALPSRNEGLPNTVLEAMASGIPPLVTDISGSRDLVADHQTGRILPTDVTAPQIAEALTHYLDHPADAEAHGRAARALIEQHYSADATLDAHEKLFRSLL